MRRVILALGLVGTTACGGFTETHEVLLRAPSPPTGRGVELYVAEQTPPRPFWEIAMLQAIGHGGDANMEDVTKALAARAAHFGCDAVVHVRVEQGYGMAHAFGVCVRWAGPAAPPPSAPPASAPAPPPPTAPPAGSAI